MRFDIGPEPAWIPCGRCGGNGTTDPCADCIRKNEDASATLRRARAMGFPPRYDWARRDAPELASRVRAIGAYGARTWPAIVDAIAADARPVVTFCGPAGAGKSSLAVACARVAPSAYFTPAADLERAIVTSSLGHEPEIISRARACRVLVIDDLGADNATKLSPFGALLRHRHDFARRTYVTTGLSAEQVRARYDEGVERRLFERAAALVIRWS